MLFCCIPTPPSTSALCAATFQFKLVGSSSRPRTSRPESVQFKTPRANLLDVCQLFGSHPSSTAHPTRTRPWRWLRCSTHFDWPAISETQFYSNCFELVVKINWQTIQTGSPKQNYKCPLSPIFSVYFRFWEDLPWTFPKSECVFLASPWLGIFGRKKRLEFCPSILW